MQISIGKVLGMSMRGTLTNDMVEALIIAKENTKYPIELLESHLIAHGNVKAVALASQILDSNNIQYEPYVLLAFDLARENTVLRLVESFIKAHNNFSTINLKDFIKSYINGKDVIALVEQNKFTPE